MAASPDQELKFEKEKSSSDTVREVPQKLSTIFVFTIIHYLVVTQDLERNVYVIVFSL